MQKIKQEKKNHNKYRKDKPWDDPNIDKWKVQQFLPEHNPHGLLQQSSFSILFPQYRQMYIRQIFPILKQTLKKHYVIAQLNLTQGSISVNTTKRTYDPYIIIKARDLIRLLSRSVPYQQAIKILEDNMYADIIKISGFSRNTQRFIKRRQRIIGPNGMTLKALQLLTKCYILVQGNTVSVMGYFKDIKVVRRIVEDTMKNIHPVYHIKQLMIKRELAKRPELANENWDRFLPKFKKQCVKRKKLNKQKREKLRKKKNQYTPFPPEQMPRKEDIQMQTGEYFLSNQMKKEKKVIKKAQEKELKKKERQAKRQEAFIPPQEQESGQKKSAIKKKLSKQGYGQDGSIEQLRKKFGL